MSRGVSLAAHFAHHGRWTERQTNQRGLITIIIIVYVEGNHLIVYIKATSHRIVPTPRAQEAECSVGFSLAAHLSIMADGQTDRQTKEVS